SSTSSATSSASSGWSSPRPRASRRWRTSCGGRHESRDREFGIGDSKTRIPDSCGGAQTSRPRCSESPIPNPESPRMSKKKVFQFLDIPREMPRKVPLQLRTEGDWNELYGKFGQPEAAFQSGRCLDCGNPYCEAKCP